MDEDNWLEMAYEDRWVCESDFDLDGDLCNWCGSDDCECE